MKKTNAIVASAALCLIPAALAFATVGSHHARGPGWLAPNADLEYTYLLNALRFQQRP